MSSLEILDNRGGIFPSEEFVVGLQYNYLLNIANIVSTNKKVKLVTIILLKKHNDP